ncbi:hypothetical protein MTR_2g032090 [Medicago truncatula]|nr:hypothetical protein MTR_2g032090 [Medicago truncatula]
MAGSGNFFIYSSSNTDVRFGSSLSERDHTTKLWADLFSSLTGNFVECLVHSDLCLCICLHSSIDSVFCLACAHSRYAMS